MTVPLTTIPRIATYRLQFTPAFGFRAALAVLPYLRELGISHIYASPIAQAVPGSQHGYDVCDPRVANPELGTHAELLTLLRAARGYELGWIQDVVPNHMAMSPHNPLLRDVLRFGRRSRWAFLFDIDWEHRDLGGRLLLPFLAEPYAGLLQAGAFRLAWDDGPVVRHGELRLPLAPGSIAQMLAAAGLTAMASALQAAQEEEDAERRALLLERALLPDAQDQARADAVLAGVGDPQAIDRVLRAQPWLLAWWRSSREVLGYRRFFAVDGLIAVRNEDPRSFPLMHGLACELYDQGLLDGVRVDHIDGLWDPADYLARLRARLPDAWILVEKILGHDERLPPWRVDGTTGYEVVNALTGICCNQRAEARLTALHQRIFGATADAARLAITLRQDIDALGLGGDLDRVVGALRATADDTPLLRDVGRTSLRQGVAALVARLRVYRTYATASGGSVTDARMLREASDEACGDCPGLAPVIAAIATVLLQGMQVGAPASLLEALMRLQQLSGPVMAKGWEDTFLFRWSRCLAFNEVGGDPMRFGLDAAGFVAFAARPGAAGGLNTTSTHDTKRGEDARARLAALTWRVDAWQDLVLHWEREPTGRPLGGEAALPTGEDRYHLYQALAATWPLGGAVIGDYHQRLRAYALKAVREGGARTSWAAPDAAYEGVLLGWLDTLLVGAAGRSFRRRMNEWIEGLAPHAAGLGLVQTVLKCTIPGIPDIYQGAEWHDLSLVDPDNRRPVDFAVRAAELRHDARYTGAIADPRTKQSVLAACLHLRRTCVEPWRSGTVHAVELRGAAEGVLAFARVSGDAVALVVVCMRPEGPDPLVELVLAPEWRALLWHEVFSRLYLQPAESLSVIRLLRQLPCAILVSDPAFTHRA